MSADRYTTFCCFFLRAAREPALVLWVLHTVPTENVRLEYVCGNEAKQLNFL